MKPSKKAFFISLVISLLAVQASAALEARQARTSSAAPADPPATSAKPETTSKATSSEAPPTTSSEAPPTTSTTAPTTEPTAQPTQTNTEPNVITISTDVVVTQSVTSSSSSQSASATAGNSKSSNDDGGLGTGSIIGLSVAGGVAVLGIIAFFVWKFTRKRFSDFDDNEAIKWPDLNNHGNGVSDSHPLPVKNTGRAGFDTGSEGSLSRVESTNYSTPDFHGGAPDPYAVPPLPHLNPNQPYQDEPTGGTGYYDPYRGPIPGSIEHGAGQGAEWGHHPEAIPMTQLGNGRMSPGPHAAYGAGGGLGVGGPTPMDAGRISPAPYAAYGRSVSPGPQAAYGGRMSPGPQAAYNTGAVSPAPRFAS